MEKKKAPVRSILSVFSDACFCCLEVPNRSLMGMSESLSYERVDECTQVIRMYECMCG